MPHYRFFTPSGVLTLAAMTLGFSSTNALAQSTTAHLPAVLESRMALRDLWVEHVFWIRSHVIATHAHDPLAAAAAEQEVVANAKALAATLTPFYGQGAADRLFELLAGHWQAVNAYDKATLAKSGSGQEEAAARIVSNARDIAKFLSGANPHLPEAAVFGLLSSHGGHHIAQIDQITARDFHAEAATWHAMRHHMLVISDAIVDALARQFPQNFKEAS